MNRLSFARQKVDKLLSDLERSKARCHEEKRAVGAAKEKVRISTEAQKIIQTAAQEIQQRAHHQIARIVTESLEAIFDDPYKFKILFEKKRGRTEARLVFDREGMEVDPLTASGGGVVDIAAFTLRLSCLMLNKPPLRRILVLDEPFRFVSPEYRGAVRKLLEELSESLQIQIILTTHMEELQTGKIIRLPI